MQDWSSGILHCCSPLWEQIKILHTLASVLISLRKLSDGASLDLTCPVSCVVEVHCKCTRFMLSLPGWRRTVLIVSVSVVVVDVLPCKNRGARWAAHGCCHEGIDEMSTSMFHDPPCFIHHLHRTWKKKTTLENFLVSVTRAKSSHVTSETRMKHR